MLVEKMLPRAFERLAVIEAKAHQRSGQDDVQAAHRPRCGV